MEMYKLKISPTMCTFLPVVGPLLAHVCHQALAEGLVSLHHQPLDLAHNVPEPDLLKRSNDLNLDTRLLCVMFHNLDVFPWEPGCGAPRVPRRVALRRHVLEPTCEACKQELFWRIIVRSGKVESISQVIGHVDTPRFE